MDYRFRRFSASSETSTWESRSEGAREEEEVEEEEEGEEKRTSKVVRNMSGHVTWRLVPSYEYEKQHNGLDKS